MRGVSQTLWILISAIVLLVAALAILTIFGSGIQPVTDIATQKSLCINQAAISCTTTGQLPSNWYSKFDVRVGNNVEQKSCEELAPCTCDSTRKLTCS